MARREIDVVYTDREVERPLPAALCGQIDKEGDPSGPGVRSVRDRQREAASPTAVAKGKEHLVVDDLDRVKAPRLDPLLLHLEEMSEVGADVEHEPEHDPQTGEVAQA